MYYKISLKTNYKNKLKKLSEDRELLEWVNKNVSFPNSMVDRITPATVEADLQYVQAQFKIQGCKR